MHLSLVEVLTRAVWALFALDLLIEVPIALVHHRRARALGFTRQADRWGVLAIAKTTVDLLVLTTLVLLIRGEGYSTTTALSAAATLLIVAAEYVALRDLRSRLTYARPTGRRPPTRLGGLGRGGRAAHRQV